ncbi:hypothetical protein NL676_036197 [Syzygium grande]|nr:hypothetical protein NL676_036197 [Syzygium grande]
MARSLQRLMNFAGQPERMSHMVAEELKHIGLLQIPGNAGCIARTCAASAIGLHHVGVLSLSKHSSISLVYFEGIPR